ncbi:MAG: hypothetical protein VYC17_02850, partial [Nitrospinota bacterium]|nr:hypothetical protein [Nitrospinota bacterium]
MENFFEKNVSNLKPLTPTVNQLENRLPDTITVQETSSGVPTIKHGNLLIHSSYDPVKEGDSFAKSVKPGDRIFLYGFGLGYHIKP